MLQLTILTKDGDSSVLLASKDKPNTAVEVATPVKWSILEISAG